MTQTIAHRLLQIALIGVCTSTITACSYNHDKDARDGGDYHQNHPIKVGSEPIALTIALPTYGGTLSPGDQAKFKAFLRTFIRRGATPVTVETSQPNVARSVLLQHGLREGEFILTPIDDAKEPTALLSFRAAKVVTPECGDWTSPSGYTGSNKLHSNYGCSLQRNVGEMIDDPNRLITAAPTSGGSASRTDADIFSHQSGTAKDRLLDGN